MWANRGKNRKEEACSPTAHRAAILFLSSSWVGRAQAAVRAPTLSHPCLFSDQLFGWLLIGVVAILVFLTKCLKHYCSPLSYRQEAYWAQYRTNEDQLFQRTAEVHSRVLAANNVRRFFGFVALNKDDEELVTKFPVEGTQPRPQWNAITGVYLYRENQGLPLYSRLHKWAQGLTGNGTAPDNIEMALLTA